MNSQRKLGLVAGAATLLAAAPLAAIFDRWTWLLQCAVAVALVTVAAALARALRAPVWSQPPAMLLALVLALTWLFPSGDELGRVLPTPATVGHFADLLARSGQDIRNYGVPVPDIESLLFLTVVGVGGVAVLVDLLSVGLRRPALAGLPMLAIYSVPVAIYAESLSPLPFVVGAMGFLWLLVADNVEQVRRFGRRFTGDGRDVDAAAPSPLAAAGRRLSVVGVVLAILLPLAVPGMTSGLIDTFQLAGGQGPGGGGSGSGRVNLFAALSGQLNQSEVRELVRLTTTDPAPAYLRFAVADEIRPDGFASRPPSGRPLTPEVFTDPRGKQRGPGVAHQAHRATVQVSPDFDMPMLPTYQTMTGVRDLTGAWLYDPDTELIYAHRGRVRDRDYSFDYVRTSYSPAALRRSLPLPADDPLRQQFTAVPDEPEVDALVRRLIAGKRTEYDRVRAIYDHFSRRNGFSYSLRTEGGTDGRAIVDFLTRKVGFCQQYAAAMAWLVRSAGIPARVAFGFTNGTERQDDTIILTNRNLHAWTEVYFAGYGWVAFDATPAANVPGSTRSAWAPDVDEPAPTASSAAPSGASGGGPSAAPQQADRPVRDVDAGGSAPGPAAAGAGPTWPWWTAGGLALLIGLLGLPASHRRLLRRRRELRAVRAAPAGDAEGPSAETAPGAPAGQDPPLAPRMVVTGADAARARTDAHAAWEELVDTLVDFRITVDPAETPRATVDRLITSGRLGDAVEAGRLLGRAEERARYAREPLQAAALPGALRSVRRALAAGADRRTRWLAAVLPPSVLRRWRLSVADGVSRVVGASGRWRETLARWSPRRLLSARMPR